MARSYIDNAEDPRRNGEQDPCRFDVYEHILVLMTLSFLTKNVNATHRFRQKVLEFLEEVDEMQYGDNQDLVWRIALARAVGRAVQKGNAKSVPAVEARVLEDTEWADYHAAFFDSYRNDTGHAVEGYVVGNELPDEDVAYVDSYVSTRLRFAYLWKVKGFFREMADRIDAGDMGDVATFNEKVMLVTERLVQKGRNAQALSGYESMDFGTGDSTFAAAVRATHAVRNKPQSVVRTGVKMLNEMLGGGYEGSRVYVHFGRSGDWKSGILCSASFWACDGQLNPRYETKDPTRKPCVLFITGENDMFETVERMVSFGLGHTVDLRNEDPDEVVRAMETVFSSETCAFEFKYRPSNTVSMHDVDIMVHDLYLEGKEVVMIVMDYIKRFKSTQQFRDQRHLELGSIVDDMSITAKRLNIPVVTGMQLNRGAYEKFASAMEKGDMEAIKKLGANDAGESINVFENADCVIFQGRVPVESTNRLWLTMRRAKMRGKRTSSLDFFAQPFDVDENGDTNEMRLQEDALLPGKQCYGNKNLADGLARDFDPNADQGGQTAEERSMGRSADVLKAPAKKPATGGKKHSAPLKKAAAKPRNPIPEDAGEATIEEVPDHEHDGVASLGLEGLEVPTM